MKYGLLTYKYLPREGYDPQEFNIGDYVQSIAARQFLPHVDTLVDRDSVASYSGEPIKLIMNGWWHIFEGNEVTSEAITPLYVSCHIRNPEGLSPQAIEHLKKHSPIGCRDNHTMNSLLERGVEAYLTSCLTSTLGKTYHVSKNELKNTVYFVDCDYFVGEKPGWIRWLLSKYARRFGKMLTSTLKRRIGELIEDYIQDARIEKRTHMFPMSIPDDERFRIADQFLRDYSKAKLVVTSRLHCALPVYSMGVPVLFVHKNLSDPRFSGTLDCINKIGLDDNEQTLVYHLFSPSHSLKAHADRLSLQCEQFIR